MSDGTNDRTGEGSAGRRVGLGRVVEDHLTTGTPKADEPPVAAPNVDAVIRRPDDDETDGSFPASDPPSYMSQPTTPVDRDET